MNDQERKAMEMAIEVLESDAIYIKMMGGSGRLQNEAQQALRQALNVDAIDTSSTYVDENEKREHEPVAWRWLYNGKPDSHKCFDGKGPDADVILRAASSVMPRTVQYFYTAPPSKPWVSLTDEQINDIKGRWVCGEFESFADCLAAIDAALRSKNNG